MKKTTIVLTSALTALALTACGTTGGSAEDDPTSGTNRPSSSSTSSEASPEPPPEEESSDDDVEASAPATTTSDDGILEFGESHTYDDGVQVTFSEPEQFTSGEWAIPEGAAGVRMTVTVVNGTDAAFDPTLSYATAQSGNVEAEEIYDTDNGLNGPPSTSILPGREVTFDIGFATDTPDDLVIQFSPDAGIEYSNIIYATGY